MRVAAKNNPAAPKPHDVLMLRAAAALVACYVSFIAMEAVHEFGHVFHAWLTGTQVVDVSIPLLGFSATRVGAGNYETFIVAGGPTWGVAIPVLACGLAYFFAQNVPEPLKFFAGFCLIANGLYLALGCGLPATDAGKLVRMRFSIITLVGLGIFATAAGLLIWHRLTWLTFWRRKSAAGSDQAVAG